MGGHAPLSDDERDGILADLRAGMKPAEVAKKWRRSERTVHRLGAAAGLGGVARKKADQARRDWALAERVGLLNKGFEKAEELLGKVATPHGFQAWAVAVGILIDKRRLEDGDATERTGVEDGGARERVARRIAELAARAGQAPAAGGVE